MNKCFYLKMAVGNLRRNKEIYFPYLLASGLMIMVFYTFMLIAGNPGMENIPQSDMIQMIMTIGVWVGAIFSVIFIFYANSFLMKRRKKEFGLYGILGLEKRHVARIMVYETGLAAFCAVGGGIIIGTVFSKLSFLILLKVMHVTKDSTLIIRLSSVVKTVILFLCIFLLAAVFNLLQIRMSHPIDLMSSKSKGEKEPKGSVVLAILGVIFLGIGYYLALTVRRDMLDLPVMFEAVLAVMVKENFFIGYGGLVFMGVMLSILFLLAMVLIIYYKQLSEGMEDRERYQIMLKVGIEEKDIKKTISKQVRTIFFVPLIVSVIHTAAAFKLTSNLISSVMYRNYPLFAGCTVIVVLFAAAVYGAVYGITAKIYYKLIH